MSLNLKKIILGFVALVIPGAGIIIILYFVKKWLYNKKNSRESSIKNKGR